MFIGRIACYYCILVIKEIVLSPIHTENADARCSIFQSFLRIVFYSTFSSVHTQNAKRVVFYFKFIYLSQIIVFF